MCGPGFGAAPRNVSVARQHGFGVILPHDAPVAGQQKIRCMRFVMTPARCALTENDSALPRRVHPSDDRLYLPRPETTLRGGSRLRSWRMVRRRPPHWPLTMEPRIMSMKVMAPFGRSRSMQAPLRWVTADPPRRVGSGSQGADAQVMLRHERRQLGTVQLPVPNQPCQRPVRGSRTATGCLLIPAEMGCRGNKPHVRRGERTAGAPTATRWWRLPVRR